MKMSGNSNSQSLNPDNSSIHVALTTSLLDAQMLSAPTLTSGTKGVTSSEDLYSDPEGSEVNVDSKQMMNEEPKTIIETIEDIALDLEETVSRVSFVVQKALETPVYSKRRLIFLCILYIFAGKRILILVHHLSIYHIILLMLIFDSNIDF